jgi:hypothetical protein
MAQEGIPRGNLFQNVRCAVAILDSGTVHHEADQETDRICHDVTFPPLDLLASVIPPNAAIFRGFHALAVHCLTVECGAFNEKG